MKEKRESSRALSLWAYPALLIVVLVVFGLTWWFGLISPLSTRVLFKDTNIYWDAATKTLSFFTFPPGEYIPNGYYTLDQTGHITCEWRHHTGQPAPEAWGRWDEPKHSLTDEQQAVLEAQYGDARFYDVVDSETIVLIVGYWAENDDYYMTKLVVLKNEIPTQTIDAQTLYWMNIECGQSQPYLILNGIVLILSAAVALIGIRRMPHRKTWLLIFTILILFSFKLGYEFSINWKW